MRGVREGLPKSKIDVGIGQPVEQFDVLVIGAGLAGCAAAYEAARAGLQVVLAERGPRPGTKTVSGGLLYTHGLREMFPEFWKEDPSPVERAITRNVVSFLTPTQAASLDFYDASFGAPPFNAFSVLRSRLDPWLAAKAEAAGATPVYGAKVDALLKEKDRVIGIRSGTDELGAGVVIDAEGANAWTARQGGQQPEADPDTVGVGVKQVIGLPPGEIERRFQLRGMEGTQFTTVGFPTGVEGGAFLYTNRETLSLGMILNMRSLVEHGVQFSEALEDFKQHPWVQRFLEGGTLLEYSGCFVTEGGLRRLPSLFGPGYLLAGAAAGLFLNTGFTLRGMDFALESGRIAGRVAAESVRAKDPSAAFLARYAERLEQSFVLRHLRTYQDYPSIFANPRLYGLYPEIMTSLLHRAYFVDGTDREHLRQMLKGSYRGRASLLTLGRDLWKAMRTL
jgi:electron transfer flavoprotein-quinone oxidoreductase